MTQLAMRARVASEPDHVDRIDQAAYTVLLRTFNCETTILSTLRSLNRQTVQPSSYVVVDSGSTDRTIQLLPEKCVIHRYIGNEFNYSGALNQGLEHISAEYVLIISSHTALENPEAAEHALRILNSDLTIGAAYFCNENAGPLTYRLIDATNFDGFNGLWNTCSIIRASLLRRRPFRRDVFAAEDQEWARWWLVEERGKIARFSGAGMGYRNPRGYPLRKRLNDYVSIAYFTNRRLLQWRHLVRIAFDATINLQLSVREKYYRLWLLLKLVECRFRKPRASSRYF